MSNIVRFGCDLVGEGSVERKLQVHSYKKKLEVKLLPAGREESILISLLLSSIATLQMEITRRELPIARAECASILFAV